MILKTQITATTVDNPISNLNLNNLNSIQNNSTLDPSPKVTDKNKILSIGGGTSKNLFVTSILGVILNRFKLNNKLSTTTNKNPKETGTLNTEPTNNPAKTNLPIKLSNSNTRNPTNQISESKTAIPSNVNPIAPKKIQLSINLPVKIISLSKNKIASESRECDKPIPILVKSIDRKVLITKETDKEKDKEKESVNKLFNPLSNFCKIYSSNLVAKNTSKILSKNSGFVSKSSNKPVNSSIKLNNYIK